MGTTMRALAGVIALAATVGTLGACATPEPPAAATPSVSATPVESVSPSPTPPALEPVIVAGDSCDSVVDPADLPGDVAAEAPRRVTAVAVRTLGGLTCDWRGANPLAVDLLPADTVAPDFAAHYADVVCEVVGYDGYGCRVARATDDTWALVTVFGGEGLSEVLVTETADVIATSLPSLVPGVRVDRTDRWWDLASCAAIGDALPLDTILGSTDVMVGGLGVDTPHPAPVDIVAAAAGTLVGSCTWSVEDKSGPTYPALSVTVYPGAAWDWDRLSQEFSADAVEASVTGAEAALIVDDEDRAGMSGTGNLLTDLLVHDGTNVFLVSSRELAVDARVAAASLIASQ